MWWYFNGMIEQNVEISLTSLTCDGKAVGRVCTDAHRQLVVFVQGALPGQTVLAKIVQMKKSFAEAVCIKVLQQAQDEVVSACVHAQECGGCTLQSMPYEKQIFWKKSILLEALQRIGKIKHIPFENIHPSPHLWHYRNKMEFAIGYASDIKGIILGLRSKGSHKIIATPQCLLMPKDCQPVLDKLCELMTQTGLAPWEELDKATSAEQSYHNSNKYHELTNSKHGLWRHVIIRKPYTQPEMASACHVQIITAPTGDENRLTISKLGQNLLNSELGVTGFVHSERASTTLYAQGEQCITQLGERHLCETLANVQYKLTHDAFFQVNTAAAEHLCALVQNMAALSGTEIIWDIYCGVGAPSLGFAQKALELYGVESNTQSIVMAKKNAENLGFSHCHYVSGSAERTTQLMHKKKSTTNSHQKAWPKPHVVIVDPPRAGMHVKVLQSLLAAKPKRIVYISCNPATLARDIALLSECYTLESVSAVDLFPHTTHVESCALLRRL